MRVEVTQGDLQDGARGDCYRCAVALAVNRATNDYWSVGSVNGSLRYTKGPTVWWPKDLVAHIQAIDIGQTVQPFSFEMEYPVV